MSRFVALGLLVVAFLFAIPDSALAQAGAPMGWVNDPQGCSEFPILENQGEIYVQHLDGEYDDWLFWLQAKDGPNIGLSQYDVWGNSYQMNVWAFARAQSYGDATLVLTTFPGGGLHLDSMDISSFWGWFQRAFVQQLGDSPPASVSSTEPEVRVVLPDELAYWEAGLESGPARFPRLIGGWPELAFAPLRELDHMYPDDCTSGALNPDPNTGEGLLAGYNIYRLAAHERPAFEELGAQENWLDFVPMPPTDASQAELHDPDGIPFTGDEVLTYLDGSRSRDGSERLHGEAPDVRPGHRYWYAVQAVARGGLQDFGSVALSALDPADYRDDLDGDGQADAIDIDGPGSANGPEFVSPQAEEDEWGLGLTSGGRAHLSKRMAVDVTQLQESIPQLRLSGDDLIWGGGPQDVSHWLICRSRDPERLSPGAEAGPETEWTVSTRVHRDESTPTHHGGVWFYRVEPMR